MLSKKAVSRTFMGFADVAGDFFRVERGWVDVHAGAWLQDVGDHHADDQRQGREGQEIDHGLGDYSSDRSEVAHAGDAGDDRQKDDGGDDHLDQLDEAIAQRFHGSAVLGPEITQRNAKGDCDQYLDVEDPVPRQFLGGWAADASCSAESMSGVLLDGGIDKGTDPVRISGPVKKEFYNHGASVP